VNFRYSEEQLALRETLQRYMARDYDFERRRTLVRSPLGYSAEAWACYAEFGVLALPFPEEFAGLGGNFIDVMAVMEMVGQGLLLEPILSTVVICGGLICNAAPASVKRALLPRIGAGSVRLALACYEAGGRYDLGAVACRAERSGDGWCLSGRKNIVLDAPSADFFLVSARVSGASTAADGISLFLVKRHAPGLQVIPYPTHSGGRAADLGLERVAAEELIGPLGEALPYIEHAADRGNAALCAEAVGIMAALNETTLKYLKTRKQFGVPIGSFQALQHRMADMYIAAEQARSMAIIAAVNADSREVATRRRLVSGAKAFIGQTARFVGQQAVQLHGAMGVVDEHIVGHYFKRLTMIDLCLGNEDFHLARFSDSLLNEE
jgi:alkylation response protein AidB-like acyl-CoA dehydrogenase